MVYFVQAWQLSLFECILFLSMMQSHYVNTACFYGGRWKFNDSRRSVKVLSLYRDKVSEMANCIVFLFLLCSGHVVEYG